MNSRVPRKFVVADPVVIWSEDATHGLVPVDGDRASVGLWGRSLGEINPLSSAAPDLLWEVSIDGVSLQPKEAA